VQSEIEEAEAAFDAMCKKLEEQAAPLYVRRNEINSIRKQANRAQAAAGNV
jgi:hypothetical protein